MKNIIIFIIVSAMIAVTGCKNSSKDPSSKIDVRTHDGHYTVTPTVVAGDCPDVRDVILVVWKGVITDDGIHGYQIDGDITGNSMSGVGIDENGNAFTFSANIGRFGVLDGDFEHEHCEGWLSGNKIL